MAEMEITRMKQIKIFYYSDTADREVEKAVNAWIADNNIDVVDVRFGSYCTPDLTRYRECIEVMVIYEVEAT
jgi:hypothetical protein